MPQGNATCNIATWPSECVNLPEKCRGFVAALLPVSCVVCTHSLISTQILYIYIHIHIHMYVCVTVHVYIYIISLSLHRHLGDVYVYTIFIIYLFMYLFVSFVWLSICLFINMYYMLFSIIYLCVYFYFFIYAFIYLCLIHVCGYVFILRTKKKVLI